MKKGQSNDNDNKSNKSAKQEEKKKEQPKSIEEIMKIKLEEHE